MAKIHRVRWKFEDNLAHRKFVAERLKDLRNGLSSEIHGATSEHSLRLATWNIMHFGNSGAYDRTTESMLYISQIIDHFDLVAVQEVNRNMAKLRELLDDYLGSEWDYLVTDTSGRPTAAGTKDAGNDERLAFLFRKSKVNFHKEVGEIVLPTGQEIAAPDASGTTEHVQFARTPFSVHFQSGWLKFRLCTVHIHYGDDQSEDSPDLIRRQKEIAKIAEFLRLRQEEERNDGVTRARREKWARPSEGGWDANYILLGDFNIVSPEHKTMKALEDEGFTVETRDHSTNLGKERMHYDQIAHKAANPHFKVLGSGVFDFLKYVYRDEDIDHYYNVAKTDRIVFKFKAKKPSSDMRDLASAKRYFQQTYRRNQMSDHKLLWCEIAIDYSDEYLDAVIADSQP